MKINLHIERLILDGVPIAHHEGSIVKLAVEAELTRLLAAKGLNTDFLSGGAVPWVKAGSMQLTGDNHPRDWGQRIARAVYGGLGQ